MQTQHTAAVPMAMQIWKHRSSGGEVKIVWANNGKVAWTPCHTCKSCTKEQRCSPNVQNQPEFSDTFQYARAF